MGLFGGGRKRDINDEALLGAMRKRVLDEIKNKSHSDAHGIVNNVYGGTPGGGGIFENLREHQDDPNDYFVDIDREDKVDHEGNKVGWTKRVRRYRDKKKVHPE